MRDRNLRLAVALLLALAVVAYIFEAQIGQGTARGESPPTIHSSAPDGARALALWLASLGYTIDPIELRPFDLDDDASVLFVLAPSDAMPEAHVDAIVGWVENGGTLVLAESQPSALAEALGIEIVPMEGGSATARPTQPLLGGAVLDVEARASAHLAPTRDEWLTLLRGDGAPIVAVGQRGAGRMYVVSTTYPFTNEGIDEADNAELVLALLSAVPAGATIAFDEYHHGLTEHGTLGRRLLIDPWGWAVLLAITVVFAFVALSGRRFGRAVPDQRERARRATGEYVSTLADALREGGHVDWLRQSYARQLRRALARRFHVRADLPAEEMVAALARRRPEAAELLEPLGRLEGGARLDEAAVIELMRRSERIRERLVEA